MKRFEKLISVAAALTLVVALSGCITSFIIDIWLDPQWEFNQVIIKSYAGSGTGTIIRAMHEEDGTAYNMLTDPSHYTWVTTTVASGTTDMIVCYWAAHSPGPGHTHTVTLVIQDIDGRTAEATVTKSI